MEAKFIRGLIYVIDIDRKSKGPSTDPCGTPHKFISLFEIFVPTCVLWTRFIKNEENQSWIIPLNP
jgi:hypothetical protein